MVSLVTRLVDEALGDAFHRVSIGANGILSLTPCFSWVHGRVDELETVSTVLERVRETVETVFTSLASTHTQLKQGVNKRESRVRQNMKMSGLKREIMTMRLLLIRS